MLALENAQYIVLRARYTKGLEVFLLLCLQPIGGKDQVDHRLLSRVAEFLLTDFVFDAAHDELLRGEIKKPWQSARACSLSFLINFDLSDDIYFIAYNQFAGRRLIAPR